MKSFPSDPALLRGIGLLADLADEELEWLAAHGQWLEFEHDEHVIRRGDPPDSMTLVLEGELQARMQETGDEVVFRARTGEVTGLLPFSRMTEYPAESRSFGTTRLVRIAREDFPEMLRTIPVLEGRLVGLMTDRVRETTRRDEQREKLMALGRLSAGLAHELNNPAAAAMRAAHNLGQALSDAQRRTAVLAARLGVDGVLALEEHLRGLEPPPAADPLARSDQEERVAEWLEAHGAAEGWEWAPTLVEAGVDNACLVDMAEDSDGALTETLGWLEATLRVRQLLHAVEGSTGRISTLVKAVKSYTYMDQAARKEVDLHEGLESTLTLLGHKLRGVDVVRDYRRDLPRVPAYGGDLNQVWTNLIDNAADAMCGSGTLRVRTALEGGRALVEISDTGPGIPPDVLGRVWDPFFTTKEPGKGTGLGLEIARRIVEVKHGGEIEVESRPGETRFRVWLPMEGGGQGIKNVE